MHDDPPASSGDADRADAQGHLGWTPNALKKIGATWESRSRVRRFELPDPRGFDEGKKDFLPELLPFHAHPAFADAPERERDRVLSCAWLAYNAKTIDIEGWILTPACLALYDQRNPGICDGNTKSVIGQTLTDEAFHVLMTHHASEVTRTRRGLGHLRIPKCSVLENMLRLQATFAEAWKRDIVVIVSAIVTEVFICGYLRKLSAAEDVQPMNVLTTKAHLMDELTHASLFKALARALYAGMTKTERDFFVSLFKSPIEWFADLELHVWDSILEQIDFPRRKELIADMRAQPAAEVDCSGLEAFFEEVGIDCVEQRVRIELGASS